MKSSIKLDKNTRMITCVIPQGTAIPLMKSLKTEKGIDAAFIHSARGSGMVTPFGRRGIGQQIEKDIMHVMVSAKEAEEVFEYLYEHAHIDRPHGGLIYMEKLSSGTAFILPDLPQEE